MPDRKEIRDARDALQRAIRHTRKRFSAGTPEKYPATPLYGLRLSEAEALAAELLRVTEKVGQYESLIGEADDELERVSRSDEELRREVEIKNEDFNADGSPAVHP